MNCRCGHGRGWHRTSTNATRLQRRAGRPTGTGHLPCQFRPRLVSTTIEAHDPRAALCGCRDYKLPKVRA